MDLSFVQPFDTAHLRGLSPGRRASYLRLLSDFDPWLCAAAPTLGDAEAIRWFLKRQLDEGYGASTLRKHLAMIKVFFEWGHAHGQVDAQTLVAVRAVRPPVAVSHQAHPRPYRPSELRTLRAGIAQRWAYLAEDDARKWLGRFRDGRSPYSRIRSHVIRAQLDAIIGIALQLGLRRREIFALDVVTAHPDNETVVVRGHDLLSFERARRVPWTDAARAAMSAWIECRRAIAPEHDRLWLNLHAEPTAKQPMTVESFNRLLATYVGRGWTFKRLRDTCAAGWVRSDLPLEHLRELLGLSNIHEALPYARVVGGSLEGRMSELDEHFNELVGPIRISGLAV